MVLMLEPLFRCNLSCAGCGKIDYPKQILDQRMGIDQCLMAAEECGAPVVSIVGGEPLVHEDMPAIVAGLVARKRYVNLCTNGVLLERRLKRYVASRRFCFLVHMDGTRERHDASVRRPGAYDRAVKGIRLALGRGFRVAVSCTFYQGQSAEEVAGFLDDMMALGIEGVTLSPGFPYEQAPDAGVFLGRGASERLFRDVFRLGRGRGWRFRQPGLFLDFLAGNQAYQCTPWGNPTRNIFGWQRPCYLLAEGGYARTFNELMGDTEWAAYGRGRNPRCAECMTHFGHEATAVNDAWARPLEALRVWLRPAAIGVPKTQGGQAAADPQISDELPEAGNEVGAPEHTG